MLGCGTGWNYNILLLKRKRAKIYCEYAYSVYEAGVDIDAVLSKLRE